MYQYLKWSKNMFLSRRFLKDKCKKIHHLNFFFKTHKDKSHKMIYMFLPPEKKKIKIRTKTTKKTFLRIEKIYLKMTSYYSSIVFYKKRLDTLFILLCAMTKRMKSH